jgi:ATP-dependent Clp protease protease subunit
MNIKPLLINPLIYEKTANGEKISDVFSRLMEERIIFLGEDIDSDVANNIVSQLLWLDNQSDEKEIHLYINSAGGCVNSMFAIYDIMQYVKAPICTYVIGLAASAASVLLCAGTKGSRYSLPNSEIMVHQPWINGIFGQVTDVNIQAEQLNKTKKSILSILARHTGNTYEKVEKDCERDLWLTPEMAIKYGLIDEITQPNKEIPPLLHEKKTKKNK